MTQWVSVGWFLAGCAIVSAAEYHVATEGSDLNSGAASSPFKTISAAARMARPGDVITVHEGVYRERVNPPRGGTSDRQRIVYRAAPGERALIKGSEVVKGWRKAENDAWKVTVDNDLFGDFNPYSDEIHGDWFNPLGRKHHTGAVYLNDHWLTEAATLDDVLKPGGAAASEYGASENGSDLQLWFAEVNAESTTLYAQFRGVNPNEARVEINVRRTVFYPEAPGVNYITVRGFSMMHAATPWSPPTAEQIGLIGTHWSKGWIIEDNDIRYSVCAGITLGKHGDQFDNTSANSAEGYVKTIERATANGWSKENIGHHIVRNNRVAHCEQAGIVGSLGAGFSIVTGNSIHDIHVRRLFTGAEMAGIKFHGAIDTVISQNHIYRACRGIWLDWMTQGTRVTRNLLHDNGPSEDLFVEVNHGPFLVDNNICLSRIGLLVNSQGGAYAHNLITGQVRVLVGERRLTPYLKAHSTEVAGLAPNPSGDERFYNNIFVNHGLESYDPTKLPVFMAGNLFLNGAKPSKLEPGAQVLDADPNIRLVEKSDGLNLRMTIDPAWGDATRALVTTDLLGKAKTPDLPYEQADGSPYRIDTDYLGNRRNPANPCVGPLEYSRPGTLEVKVW